MTSQSLRLDCKSGYISLFPTVARPGDPKIHTHNSFPILCFRLSCQLPAKLMLYEISRGPKIICSPMFCRIMFKRLFAFLFPLSWRRLLWTLSASACWAAHRFRWQFLAPYGAWQAVRLLYTIQALNQTRCTWKSRCVYTSHRSALNRVHEVELTLHAPFRLACCGTEFYHVRHTLWWY